MFRLLGSGTGMTRAGRITFGVALMALAAGCGSSAGTGSSGSHSTVTISLWSGLSGPDQTGFKRIIDGFNASQKAVKVSYNQNSYNGYATKLAAALSAGQAPNIWTLDAATSATYMAQGQMTALSSQLLSKFPVLASSNFTAANWNAYQYKGKQYMLPLDAVALMLYYNKALLNKAGFQRPVISGGFNTIVNAAQKLTGNGVYGLVIPTDWPMQFLWPTTYAQFGGSKAFNTQSNSSNYNSPAAVQALTTLHNLIYQYHVGPKAYAVDQDLKMLANGSAAQIYDGSWQMTNPTLKTLGKNLGVSVVPQLGPDKKYFIGDTGFALYKKNSSAQNDAALKFISYYETHSIDMAKVGDVPVYKPVLQSPAFKALGGVAIAAQELRYGVYSPPVPNYSDTYLYNDALWPVLRGQSSNISGDLQKAAAAITNHMRNGSG